MSSLLRREPALIPLFAAVGLGVVGSLAFATHYLSSNSDVVIRKKGLQDSDGPWNAITQGRNTKLMSFNQDFWKNRAGMPDPRAAFQDLGANPSDAVKVAKAKAIAKANAAKEQISAH
ncbi:hypothetical protein MNV49_004965 [Pseudohyphozyma bogoriensis]|nr:hypothetical protein MNV49_004965 [Pseudohyphozyma bogoriensis]